MLAPPRNPVTVLRRIGLLEAISFLVLMGIAMPLKYAAGHSHATVIPGWIHGILFVAFCGSLLHTTVVAKWPLGRAALVFGAALVPFGPFLIDRRMQGWEAERQKRMPTAQTSSS